MNFYCHSLDLHLAVEENFILQLVEEGRKHYPKEYGGILVGRYSNDKKTCHVEKTILPIEYKSSKYLFERGRTGLVEELTNHYNSEPRLIYIGEWHTHPDGSPTPSNTDEQAMKIIAEDEQVMISSPILIVLGLSITDYSISLNIHHKRSLYNYEKR